MQSTIKELELDMSELLFLLEETKKRPEFAAIARRHIIRLSDSLEKLRKELEQMQIPDSMEQGLIATTEKADSTECTPETPVVAQEEEIPIESIEPKSESEKEEEPNSTTVFSITVLGEQLKPSGELIKSISLNDTFRFSRELFDGDTEKMNRTLQEITQMNMLSDVISYVSSQTIWDEESDATKDFIELLRKYFV